MSIEPSIDVRIRTTLTVHHNPPMGSMEVDSLLVHMHCAGLNRL